MESSLCISLQVNKLARVWSRQLDNILFKNGHNLTSRQYYTLLAVREYGPIGSLELADMLASERTTITRGMVLLCKRKFTDIKVDKDDRRRSHISILSEGIKVLDEAGPLVEKFEKNNAKMWNKVFDSIPKKVTSSSEVLMDGINLVLDLIEEQKDGKNV